MRKKFAVLWVLTAIGLAASPAIAGRGTQIDVASGTAPLSTCSLGSTSCSGIDVSNSGLFSTAYVYREGIVSFDQLLPVGATSTNLASLGSVSYFTAGFSDNANYTANLFKRTGPVAMGFTSTSAYGFNFYKTGDPLFKTNLATGQLDVNFPNVPYLQVLLSSVGFVLTPDKKFDGVQLAAGYGFNGAEPLADALIGFSILGVTQTVRNADGLLIGADVSDSNIVTRTTLNPGSPGGVPIVVDGVLKGFTPFVPASFSAPTQFTPLFAQISAVPEPSTWMMLITGFGLVGGVFRRKKRRAEDLGSSSYA